MSRMTLFCVICSALAVRFRILKVIPARESLLRTSPSCRISLSSCRRYLLKSASTEIPASTCPVVNVLCSLVSRKLYRKFRRKTSMHLFRFSAFMIPYILSLTVLSDVRSSVARKLPKMVMALNSRMWMC